MSEVIKEPTDAEFSALMDGVAPDRQREPGNETPSEQPVVPEAALPVVEAEEGDLPEKYRGKTPAEIVRMHQELESRLGQQGQELGELRALRGEFDELKQHLTAPEPESPPWESPASSFDSLDEQVLTNPKDTLDWITTHQPQLYERALQTWASLDPFGAGRYDTQHTLARERQAMQEELQAVRAPVVQSQNNAILEAAYQNVANQNPMLAQVAEDLPALLEENPEFKVLLGNGDVATRERALNNLVSIAAVKRGTTEGTPAETAAEAAHQAKLRAGVVSSGSTAERGGQTPSETFAARMLASEGTSVAEELARNRAAAVVAGQRRA